MSPDLAGNDAGERRDMLGGLHFRLRIGTIYAKEAIPPHAYVVTCWAGGAELIGDELEWVHLAADPDCYHTIARQILGRYQFRNSRGNEREGWKFHPTAELNKQLLTSSPNQLRSSISGDT